MTTSGLLSQNYQFSTGVFTSLHVQPGKQLESVAASVISLSWLTGCVCSWSLVLVAAAASPGELPALAALRVVVPLGEGAPAPPRLRPHPADLVAGLKLGASPLLGRRAQHALVPALVLGQKVVPVARAPSVLLTVFMVVVGFAQFAGASRLRNYQSCQI